MRNRAETTRSVSEETAVIRCSMRSRHVNLLTGHLTELRRNVLRFIVIAAGDRKERR